jgi:Phosphodiester glycosidase
MLESLAGRGLRLRPGLNRRNGSLAAVLAVLVAAALTGGGSVFLERHGPQAPTEIFKGISYGCRGLITTEEGSGLVYWVRVDLTAPGIELYLTPLDPAAVAQGWQYRLRRIGDVVDGAHLAVAINATLFGSKSNSGWRPRMSEDLANSVQTVVADHVVNQGRVENHLLWFDDRLTPHLQPKPPSAELTRAKWGIGGSVELQDGNVSPGSSRTPNSRTAVAIDGQRKVLLLAVGQHISPRRLLEELAGLGGKDGMLLDGGDSSSMAIGKGASGVPAGVLHGGWWPVATHFGVKAQPVARGQQTDRKVGAGAAAGDRRPG